MMRKRLTNLLTAPGYLLTAVSLTVLTITSLSLYLFHPYITPQIEYLHAVIASIAIITTIIGEVRRWLFNRTASNANSSSAEQT